MGAHLKAICTKIKAEAYGLPSTNVALRHSIKVLGSFSTLLFDLGLYEDVKIFLMSKSSRNDVMTTPKKAAARSKIRLWNAPF